MSYDIIVVGGGPAGLSAAVNARARGRSVLVVTNDPKENPFARAERVDNHLGMPGLTGADMLETFLSHARAAGAEFRQGRVVSVLPMGDRYFVSIGSDVEDAGAVVLATGIARGSKYPGEAELLGRGVSYCATCDGMLYRGRKVAVVGKSPDAPAEAEFLLRLGCEVTYVAPKRPEGLSDGIAFLPERRLAIIGEEKVAALRSGDTELVCDGVFILRAALAPDDLLPGLGLAEEYIEVDRNMATNLPGVFAAGDCTGHPFQVSKAVGEGLIAGQRAAEYLAALEKK